MAPLRRRIAHADRQQYGHGDDEPAIDCPVAAPVHDVDMGCSGDHPQPCDSDNTLPDPAHDGFLSFCAFASSPMASMIRSACDHLRLSRALNFLITILATSM